MGFTGLHCAVYLGLDEIAIGWLREEGGCSADMVPCIRVVGSSLLLPSPFLVRLLCTTQAASPCYRELTITPGASFRHH